MELPDPDQLTPRVVERCLKAAAPLEFSTYLVGIKAKREWRTLPEKELHAWKRSMKSRVGQALGEAWVGERSPDFERPQVVLVWNAQSERVERTIRSVFLYGRYRKLARGLPQTRARWSCPECRGKGCETCEHTGRRYPIAVEDLLGRPAAQAFGAPGYQLHGMGREDIDVRCLGGGRPFVLELRSPKRRSADLEAVAKGIVEGAEGRVELGSGLQAAQEGLVARVKGFEANKVYLAQCQAIEPLPAKVVMGLTSHLTGVMLEQRTPQRVSRRRSDKVRRRKVERFEPEVLGPDRFSALIEAQSGTYIKELISGDEGRTSPSVSSLTGVSCVCAELDVLDIQVEDQELLSKS